MDVATMASSNVKPPTARLGGQRRSRHEPTNEKRAMGGGPGAFDFEQNHIGYQPERCVIQCHGLTPESRQTLAKFSSTLLPGRETYSRIPSAHDRPS